MFDLKSALQITVLSKHPLQLKFANEDEGHALALRTSDLSCTLLLSGVIMVETKHDITSYDNCSQHYTKIWQG